MMDVRTRLRRLVYTCAIVAASLVLAACGDEGDDSASPADAPARTTSYPLTIKNCGRTLTFDKAPSRAVLGYGPVAELFVGLGLGEQAIGRVGYTGAFAKQPLLPDQEAAFSEIRVISNRDDPPAREEMLALRSDFYLGYGDYDFGGDGGASKDLATTDQLKGAGTRVYTVVCGGQAEESINDPYRALLDLGTIFNVRERAEQRVAAMKRQIAEVNAKVADEPPVNVIAYIGGKGPLNVAGGLVVLWWVWEGLCSAGANRAVMVAATSMVEVKEYEALQHFLADSPWDGVLDRAVAERVCAVIEPTAWVLDDTGVPKDGKRSPGVKRQYSGTLGKIGNCQTAVSLHAVSAKGTVPLGFRLYLPEDWCQDPERRRVAKIPENVEFQTKPALGGDLVARAAGWKIRRAPVLGDQAYGNDTKLRTRLHAEGIDYVLSIGPDSAVFEPGTVFAIPSRKPGSRGPAPSSLQTESQPQSIAELVAGLDRDAFQTVAFRDIDGQQLVSRFAFVRVIAAHPVTRDRQAPREEWLIVEWPEGRDEPTDYWISNLPADTEPERLARLARLRWMIELDSKQLKGELGLDHYEGRSYLGFHHHCTLVTAAHGFLTLERADPNHQRPA